MLHIRDIYKNDYRGYTKLPRHRQGVTCKYSKYSERLLLKCFLKEDFYGQCIYCGWSCLRYGAEYFHIEHILSQKKFPKEIDNYENLALACPVCNTSKHEKVLPHKLNPLSVEFSRLFYRNKVGAIVPNNQLNLDDLKIAKSCISILGLSKELYKLDYIYSALSKIKEEIVDGTDADYSIIIAVLKVLDYIDKNYTRSSNLTL
ncbi:HNH endonuclease signature motif containing protein [Streptococcus sp. DD11]|uniref:HNH endonuclease signature motif containing protein n=1 Tax=Streptococcus sp. DD11 TaxID=1777879 RepID=UPI000AB70C2E|nr:HNH endonuclease signature motif containing protein [Streptococcus sp. DD11]